MTLLRTAKRGEAEDAADHGNAPVADTAAAAARNETEDALAKQVEVTKGFESLLFLSIDRNQDALVDHAECISYTSSPPCLECLRKFENQKGLRAEEVCEQIHVSGSGKINMEAFM